MDNTNLPLRSAATPAERRAMVINILIWMAIAILGETALFVLLRRWVPTNPTGLDIRAWLPRESIQLVTLLIASVVVAKREGVTLGTYGLPGRGAFGAKFWEGAVWGFVTLSALVGALVALKFMHVDSVALAGPEALMYGAGWAVTFIVLGMWEEFFFRGYLLYRISTRMGFWSAAFLMSAAFGIAHLGNGGETVLGIAQVFVFGLFACFALRRTGSLWFPIGYHALWDWAQTFFYGTPDSGLASVGHYLNSSASGPAWLSGGTGGPEGSVLSLVVLAIAAIAIDFRFPQVKFPLYEADVRTGDAASSSAASPREKGL
jgi:membrane protease YdiL (CAAX protease family)